MATSKKGKKPSKPKTGSKPKKKNKKNKTGNIFSKIMLFLLLIAVLVTSVLLILKNIEDNKTTRQQDNKIEISNQESMVKNQQPEANVQQTTDNNQKPMVNSQQPTANGQETKEVVDLKKTFKENQSISGCWLSSSQGASLTLDNYGYRIDFFGVDASQPMTGKYSAENNLIIFFTEESKCEGIEGVYKITFDKKNISLICKDDDCKERKNVLETDWEWIEI